MNRLNWSLFALPVALLTASCADNDLSMQVLQNQEVLPPACVAASAPGIGRTTGTLDVGIVAAGAGTGLVLFPVVKNNLVDPGGGNLPQRNDIQLTGAEVQIERIDSHGLVVPATTAHKFVVRSFGGTLMDGATMGVPIEAFPLQFAREFLPLVPVNEFLPIMVRFRVVGTHGGGTITSGWVDYPVNLCQWCLSGGPPKDCPKGGFPKGTVTTGGCNPAQDQPVTCCTNTMDNRVLCGDAVPIASTMM